MADADIIPTTFQDLVELKDKMQAYVHKAVNITLLPASHQRTYEHYLVEMNDVTQVWKINKEKINKDPYNVKYQACLESNGKFNMNDKFYKDLDMSSGYADNDLQNFIRNLISRELCLLTDFYPIE